MGASKPVGVTTSALAFHSQFTYAQEHSQGVVD